MSRKINFKEVPVTSIDGSSQKVDFSKEIANTIYFSTKDLGIAEKARELYKAGECDCDENFTTAVMESVDRIYGAVVADAIRKHIG